VTPPADRSAAPPPEAAAPGPVQPPGEPVARAPVEAAAPAQPEPAAPGPVQPPGEAATPDPATAAPNPVEPAAPAPRKAAPAPAEDAAPDPATAASVPVPGEPAAPDPATAAPAPAQPPGEADALAPEPQGAPAAGERPRSRLPCLDGVRAIAALGVVAVHVGLISGYSVRGGALGPYFARGEVGVTVFFLLSGFLVYRPFVAAHLDGRPAPRLGPYLWRRAVRILPLYWVALTVVLFVDGRTEIENVGDFLTFYGFAQIYRAGYETEGIQQAWSLCTLVSFYLAAPVLAAAIRAVGSRAATAAGRLRVELGAVVVLVAVAYGYQWMVVNDLPHQAAVVDGRLCWLPIHLDIFGLGMALAALYHWGQIQPADRRTAATVLGRVPAAAWWAVAAVSYWYVSVRLGLPLSAGAHDPGEHMAREVLYTLVSVGLMLPAVFGPQHRGAIRWVLRRPPVAAVGILTYGVFLWHEWAIDLWIDWRDLPPLNGWWVSMLAFVLAFTLAISALTYWLVEKPAARLPWPGRGDRSRPAGPAGSDPRSPQPAAAGA
jgi:peptidoglycan/LPS O-acetylase OafA/YrhL